MTVETSNNKNGPYDLGGGTLAFPRTFKILDEDHLRVVRVIGDTEIEVESGFIQTGIGGDEGEVIFTAESVPTEGKLFLIRAVPNVQSSDYSNQARVPPERVERDFDLMEMQIQDLAEQTGRALKVPISRPGVGVTVPGDGETIMWDEGSGSFVPGPNMGVIAEAEQAAERAEQAAESAEDAAERAEDAADELAPLTGVFVGDGLSSVFEIPAEYTDKSTITLVVGGAPQSTAAYQISADAGVTTVTWLGEGAAPVAFPKGMEVHWKAQRRQALAEADGWQVTVGPGLTVIGGEIRFDLNSLARV